MSLKIRKSIPYLAVIAASLLPVLSGAVYVQAQEASAETAVDSGVYVFQDVKKEGPITVIKKWDE